MEFVNQKKFSLISWERKQFYSNYKIGIVLVPYWITDSLPSHCVLSGPLLVCVLSVL